jgi:TRAP-type C4-dicarboxylate transport system permease small subunit
MSLFFGFLVLWIAFCGTVYIVNRKWALQLAWLPLRLSRRALGWLFIELGRAISGRKK